MNNQPLKIACKCCGSSAHICDLVDLSHCGADASTGKKTVPYMGYPVYYYSCSQCGFVFTPAFDDWTASDFSEHIYNEDYTRRDPDYYDGRPQVHADLIKSSFDEMKSDRILDFGSGRGVLEKKLNLCGFNDISSYDPFSQPEKPAGKFDTILSFEVFEHHPQPQQLLCDLFDYLTPNGAVLFSTFLVDQSIIDFGLRKWWYCAPINGHISFYSFQCLSKLAMKHGRQFGSFTTKLHVIYNPANMPLWVEKYLR